MLFSVNYVLLPLREFPWFREVFLFVDCVYHLVVFFFFLAWLTESKLMLGLVHTDAALRVMFCVGRAAYSFESGCCASGKHREKFPALFF